MVKLRWFIFFLAFIIIAHNWLQKVSEHAKCERDKIESPTDTVIVINNL